ncbi:RNA polymerase Rpb4-domain-containing protein [Chaetomium sp. MPI-SDFR-AT-0129]|nr:RNA polymerase Rpb4-domain-containing protein [Chaetomium sp. MPI-SDFR-AT-0129]
MKILESQNALLSNYEVYQHIVDQRKRNKTQDRRLPGNAHHVLTEVFTYLSTKPSPLAQQETTQAYSGAAIAQLLEKLRAAGLPSELTKGELLSILNVRPSSTALLSTAIEDMEERFGDDEQNTIVEIIGEVLGVDEPTEGEAEAGAGEVDAEGEMDAEGEVDPVPVRSVENGL